MGEVAAWIAALPEAVLVADERGVIVNANPLAAALFGYSDVGLVGTQLPDLLPSDVRAGHERSVSAWLERPRTTSMSRRPGLRARRADGSEFACEIGLSYLEEGGKRYALALIRDVSALRESQELYRLLFQKSPLPMYVFEEDSLQILEVNDAMTQHYGWSRQELLGMTTRALRPPEDVDGLLAALRRARTVPTTSFGRWRHLKRDGTPIQVEIFSHSFRFGGRDARLTLVKDITEERRLEAQLQQAQKMEAVGQLAGGIAHDFNNVLSVVLSYVGLMRDRGVDLQSLEDMEEIEQAAQRAAALTRQLLAFSRQQMIEPANVDLCAVVANLEKMLRRVIGEQIRLQTDLARDLGPVFVDPSQVEQVILNLAVNARDAMPEGGTLRIAIAEAMLDQAWAETHAGARPGPHVRLTVEDSGVGMDAMTRAHIFEPFFSTKRDAGGTGLGLATVYGIVRQSSGHVVVDSEPGRGTRFDIFLPRLDGADHASHRMSTLPPRSSGGTETILLVEDEAPVRRAARSILKRRGYTVVEAANGEEALALAARHPDITLVVTDVVMPGMNGRELALRLKDVLPNARVLFTSGYTADRVLDHGIGEGEVAFLRKPFDADTLARKVREVMDEPA